MSSFNENDELRVRPLVSSDRQAFIDFTDQWIGKGYYRSKNFELLIELSTAKYKVSPEFSSFVICNAKEIDVLLGVRVSFFPGKWSKHVPYRFLTTGSQVPLSEVGYFKSLFIHPKIQKRGWGKRLSLHAAQQLKKAGAQAILTHSWAESPDGSSKAYLQNFGFKALGEIPHFWSQVDYLCSGCGQSTCHCTAIEMICHI